jgi:hypothetical protein
VYLRSLHFLLYSLLWYIYIYFVGYIMAVMLVPEN